MGLESTTNIAGLDPTWPTVGDPRSQGDDHLRLLKNVLKSTFPGVGGLGFSSPITATEAELNFVHGVTSNIQTQLNTLSNRPAFLANRNGVNTGTLSVNTFAKIGFVSTVDTASGWNSGASSYTVPLTGIYAYEFQYQVVAVGTVTRTVSGIFVNSVNVRQFGQAVDGVGGPYHRTSGYISLNAGDIVDFEALLSGGNGIISGVNNLTFASLVFIRP